jgi:hypothetical protein
MFCGIINEDMMELNILSNEKRAMKYVPITFFEVERSFSRYKSLLRPNHHNFNFENLREYKVCHSFHLN